MQNHFPATVTGPTHQYQRVRFIVDPEAGTLVVRARQGKILAEANGTVTPTDGGWQLTSDDGDWELIRNKGCGCGGSKVVSLT